MRRGKNGKIELNEVMRPDILKDGTTFLSSGMCKSLAVSHCRATKEYTRRVAILPQ